jgi:ATP-binding cassette subfamily C protein
MLTEDGPETTPRINGWGALRELMVSASRRVQVLLVLLSLSSFGLAFLDLTVVLMVGIATSALLASLTADVGSGSSGILAAAEAFPPWAWCLTAVGLTILKNVLLWRQQLSVERLMRRREQTVADGALQRVLATTPQHLQVIERSRIVNGVAWWAEGLAGAVSTRLAALTEAVVVATILTGLLVLNPLTTLALLGLLAPVILLTSIQFSRRSKAAARSLKEAYLGVFGSIAESVKMHREALAYGLSPWLMKKFNLEYRNVVALGPRLALLTRASTLVLEPALLLSLTVAVVVSFLTRPPSVAAGEAVVFALALSKVVAGLIRAQSQLVLSNRMLGEASSALPVLDALDTRSTSTLADHKPDEAPLVLQCQAPSLQMRDVTFSYESNSAEAFGPFSVSVPGGSRVAVVGSTGAGKSTFVDLALGILQPHTGSIRWLSSTGSDVQPILGLVPQTLTLFRGSLGENILLDKEFSKPNLDLANEALRAARASQLFNGEPDRMNRNLGEDGSLLSGGERQRVALARALARTPNVLVLDEATSALDAKTESEVHQAILALRGQVTTLIVAHRLSTVIDADLVLLLDKGRLRDAGTFPELVSRNVDFREQARLQGLAV